MKKSMFRSGLIFISSLMLLGAVSCNEEESPVLPVWMHYKAAEPTETEKGNLEFWANLAGNVSLTKPVGAAVIEGSDSDKGKYADHEEIWIENELKVTKGSDSFIIPLKELPLLYYADGSDYSDASLK